MNRFAPLARKNAKLAVAIAGDVEHGDIRNARQGRRTMRQARNKVVHEFVRSLNFNGHAGRSVGDRAGKLSFYCQPINIRTESDALYDPRYSDVPANLQSTPALQIERDAVCVCAVAAM